jgi:phenylpropionate dioxygenase-like ring-hydroxylating dioxygenase large terminal subunit
VDDITQSVFKGDVESNPRRVAVPERLTPEFHALERDEVFRKSWLAVARASEVPEKGSYVVKDLPTFKTSILIIRGTDDTVRAFYNVCTHRGNKLVRGGSGCRQRFACGFHGWIFSPEGKIENVTDEQSFKDLDKSKLDLRAINTEVWEDFVFVHLDANPKESLKEWLAEFWPAYDGYFQKFDLNFAYKVTVNCNWNLAINSFTEGYHTLYIHRNTMPDYQGGKINPQRHRPFLELLKRNHRYSAPANPDHRVFGMEEVMWRYGRKCIPAFDDDMTGLPPGINPSRHKNWAFDVVQFFPNMLLLTGNSWYIEMHFWPLNEGQCDVVMGGFHYKPKTLGEKLSQEWVLSRGRSVILEDMNTLEAQQEMLSSGAITHVQLSQQEMSLQHHYKVINEMLGIA